MDLQSALRYLDEHASYDVTGRIDSPSVDNIRALCAAMGDPQHAAPGHPRHGHQRQRGRPCR